MRVLVLVPSFPPALGGIEGLSFRLVSGFRRLEPRVLALDEPGSLAFDAENPLDIRRVFNRPRAGRRSIARLCAMSAVEGVRGRPEAVLSMHIRASYCAPMLQRTLGIPFVQYVHAMELASQPGLARYAVRHAAATIAVSSYSARLALRCGAPARGVRVIPPGVDAPVTRRERRSPVPTMVTVARLDDAYKGHDVVIEALPRIRAEVPDVRWLVVGDGKLRLPLERRSRELGLDEAVSFLGAVSDEERDRALDRAHVFVMPSRVGEDGSGGEGFGIAFLEASARGLPVIAGRGGGTVDAVLDGETGVLIDPCSAEDFARAAITLLKEGDRAEGLGAAGVVLAGRFSWPRTIARVEEAVCDVVDRRGR